MPTTSSTTKSSALNNINANLENATILTAEYISSIAYDSYFMGYPLTIMTDGKFKTDSNWTSLIDAGWTQIITDGQTNPEHHYQGVAFYKNINGTTEVIIGNRGSTLDNFGYDFRVSDAQLTFDTIPPCDGDAVTYYNNVVAWVNKNIKTSVNIIETGHSLGGQEADYVNAMVANHDKSITSTAPTVAVTFDAPGVSSTVAQSGVTYNALNISLITEGVHTDASLFNGGYLGTSVGIKGGLDPIAVGLAVATQVRHFLNVSL